MYSKVVLRTLAGRLRSECARRDIVNARNLPRGLEIYEMKSAKALGEMIFAR